jgi:hypothetical protein
MLIDDCSTDSNTSEVTRRVGAAWERSGYNFLLVRRGTRCSRQTLLSA